VAAMGSAIGLIVSAVLEKADGELKLQIGR
jgi:hypothetical protein